VLSVLPSLPSLPPSDTYHTLSNAPIPTRPVPLPLKLVAYNEPVMNTLPEISNLLPLSYMMLCVSSLVLPNFAT
jgi:hypothetical protein